MSLTLDKFWLSLKTLTLIAVVEMCKIDLVASDLFDRKSRQCWTCNDVQ